ncbi:MAG: efflux RND transporter periplasmic adaptor subunit [Marinifilaceae bacterium]|nr:efflux RND transporter periplasmic adaptor subunit [Marinifilaceae bacterium]
MRGRLNIAISILSVFMMLIIVSCKESSNVKTKKLRPVKYTQINTGNEGNKIQFPGVISESREVKLSFLVGGAIQDLRYREGDFVKKGTVVAVIDPVDYRFAYNAALAAFNNAEAEMERYEKLYNKKGISKSVYDRVTREFKMAKSNMEAKKNQLAYTTLKAPFSGYIQTKFVEKSEKVGVGHPIYTLIDTKTLKVKVGLSESDFLNFDKFENFTCYANDSIKLELRNQKLEHKPNSDNVYLLQFTCDNLEDKIAAGMSCEVFATKASNNSEIRLPICSILSENKEKYVWVISNEETVKKVKVEITGTFNKGVYVKSSSLNNGTKVVTGGIHSLVEGDKIKLLNSRSLTNIGGEL